MSYRSDHDAALARADSLAAELERERAQRRALERQLASAAVAEELEREREKRRALEQQLAAEATDRIARAETQPRELDSGDDLPASSRTWIHFVCIVMMMLGLLVVIAPFYVLTALITGRW